jgi:hypothetical protein
MSASTGETETLCPSALARLPGSRTFGVVEGSVAEPRVRYLSEATLFTPELEAACRPVTPEEVFRFAARCAEHDCQHYADEHCRLAENLTKALAVPRPRVPHCAIRRQCRWWREQGRSACSVCEHVVTRNFAPSDALREAARPDEPPEQRRVGAQVG